MAQSDPKQILLETNLWATRNILQACEKLTDEQFHHEFEMGPGSLHDTVTHILGAMRGWADMLAGREPRIRLEEGRRSATELLGMLDGIAQEFQAEIDAHDLDDVASSERGGRTYAFTRGGVLTHVTTHGMHHSTQCLNMLRQLGVDELPMNSVLEWMLTVDPVQ